MFKKWLLFVILACLLLLSACSPADPITDDLYIEGDIYQWDGGAWVILAPGAAAGDVTAAANLTADMIVRGDDGLKGVKTSTVSIDNLGNLDTGIGDITGFDINATNDLDVVNDTDIGGNLDVIGSITGGSINVNTGRSVTFSVAASDSAVTSINQADYICSGAADDVEINAALNALPALGGRVVLLEGTYVLADPIIIPKFNVTLEGQGTLPLIDGDGLATTEHAIYMDNKDNVVIRNLSIQTENGGGKDSSCIFIDNGSDNFVIDGVTFIDSDTHAVVIGGTSIRVGSITNCYINSADEHGIYLDMDGGSSTKYIAIADNIIEDTGGDGIRIWSTGIQYYFVINGNIITGVDGSAMYLRDFYGITIADNNIESPTAHGMRFDNCQYGTISSNSFYDTGADGILTESSGDLTITGNDIDTTLTAGTSDCIQINGDSNTITSNYLKDSERNGIRVVGNENVVSGNDIIDADCDGIYVSGSENLISDNVITSPGREAAGTYNGIILDADSDRCSVVDNIITDAGTVTEDGVHINDGAIEVKVSDNYIFNLMGSGVVLVANNDDCQITNNYVQACDDYGVYVVAATCDDTSIMGNTLQGNVAAEYLDNGTDTKSYIRGSLDVSGYVDWSAGNVIYVPLAGDIQTYVNNAVAGDTLILASGEYIITDTITISKEINIVGQGHSGFVTAPVTPSHGTIIACATNDIEAFQISHNNVRIVNLSINMTGDNSVAINTDPNLVGLVVMDIDVVIVCDGTAQAFTFNSSDVVIRDSTFYITSSDDTASGLLVYNDGTSTKDAIVDAFNVTGTVLGGATSAYAFGAWNNNDGGHSITLNLSSSLAVALEGTPIDVAVVSYSVTTNNAIVNAYFCTLDGADWDAYQTGTNELNLGGSVLVNNEVFGTVTYRATMTSGSLATAGNINFIGLQVFANNAAAIAGGLVAGDLYRTNGDPDLVCVVH